ncbi:CDGSH iron-sulfur domain-containing protein 2-like [Sycon ciliatum]|uniref:CDGSH iron-sulfur domain-containing protein 2-like n=1 Tax=Sycon ciliatum TaxID=27933 RepID=UPI0031F6C184
MEAVKFFFQTQLPAYLKALPIPSTVAGFADLSGNEWIQLLPVIGFCVLLVYLFLANLLEIGRGGAREESDKPVPAVNLSIDKEKDKVATSVDIEDLDDKTVYCRCWRSKKFPLCDGSHNTHNKETGDNVGPLIVKRKQPKDKSQ